MYKKSLHAIGELVRKVIRIDYKMDSGSCSHFTNMEIYVDMRHPLVSKIRIDVQLQIINFMIGGNLVNNEGRGKANKRGNASIGARLGPSSVNNGSCSSQALRLVRLTLGNVIEPSILNFLPRQVTFSLEQGNHKAVMVDENVNPNIIRTSEGSNDGVLSPASLQPSSTIVVKWKEVKKDVRSRRA
ncbi:hypothetical protein Goarm_000649 [Gossypium armourianum]|uniref:Uncharacterized protein n=1 Tax=Gossypium armourianum TaxID=34283 RepID=A0A7J9KAH6_9ROSI|nr:hypothetical protein [Gossypium armourianum]